VDFEDRKILKSIGEGLYSAGNAASATEAQNYSINQGSFESSNVNTVQCSSTSSHIEGRESLQKSLAMYARSQEKASTEIAKFG